MKNIIFYITMYLLLFNTSCLWSLAPKSSFQAKSNRDIIIKRAKELNVELDIRESVNNGALYEDIILKDFLSAIEEFPKTLLKKRFEPIHITINFNSENNSCSHGNTIHGSTISKKEGRGKITFDNISGEWTEGYTKTVWHELIHCLSYSKDEDGNWLLPLEDWKKIATDSGYYGYFDKKSRKIIEIDQIINIEDIFNIRYEFWIYGNVNEKKNYLTEFQKKKLEEKKILNCMKERGIEIIEYKLGKFNSLKERINNLTNYAKSNLKELIALAVVAPKISFEEKQNNWESLKFNNVLKLLIQKFLKGNDAQELILKENDEASEDIWISEESYIKELLNPKQKIFKPTLGRKIHISEISKRRAGHINILNNHKDNQMRQSAAEALGKIEGEKATKSLINTLKNDSDGSVRAKAAEVLGWYRSFNNREIKEALKSVKGKLRPFICIGGDKDSDVRKAAKESLKKHKNKDYSLSVLNVKGIEEQEKYITTYKKEVSASSSADIQAPIGGFEQTKTSQNPIIANQVKEQFVKVVDILTSEEAISLLGLSKEGLIDRLDKIEIYYNINKKSLADNNAEAKKIILDKEAFNNDSVLLNELLHETLHIVAGNDEILSSWQGKTKEQLQQDESFKAHKQLELRLYLTGMYLLLQTQGEGFADSLTEGYAGLDDKFMELELDNYLDSWKYSSFIRNIIEKLQAAIVQGNTPVAFDSIEDILNDTKIILEGDKIEDTNSVLNSFIASAIYA